MSSYCHRDSVFSLSATNSHIWMSTLLFLIQKTPHDQNDKLKDMLQEGGCGILVYKQKNTEISDNMDDIIFQLLGLEAKMEKIHDR